MNQYKYSSPSDWLLDWIGRASKAQIKSAAIRLACETDDDTVQDIFQNEMACDGYFTPFLMSIEHHISKGD